MYENTDSKFDLSSLSETKPLNNEQTCLIIDKDLSKTDNIQTTNEGPLSINKSNEMNRPNKQLSIKDTSMSLCVTLLNSINVPLVIYYVIFYFFHIFNFKIF